MASENPRLHKFDYSGILRYHPISGPVFQAQDFDEEKQVGEKANKKKTNMICFSGNHSSVINTDRKTRSFLKRTVRTVTTSH